MSTNIVTEEREREREKKMRRAQAELQKCMEK